MRDDGCEDEAPEVLERHQTEDKMEGRDEKQGVQDERKGSQQTWLECE